MTTEHELLLRYAHHHDEAAFADLVQRHADLVYSIARRVTTDATLAEDVTQLVFTELARRAGALCRHPTLVGWLHTTTRHTAINIIRGEARRRIREQEAVTMHHDQTGPVSNWAEIAPLLDEAVGNLGEQDRQAVLLRFFNGLSHQQVGAILGLSENSANKRIERALEKLRAHFARRGVTASSTLLAAAITANSVAAAPVGLATKTARSALASGAASGGLGSTTFFTLLSMTTKTKVILIVAVLLAIVGTLVIKWSTVNDSSNLNTAALVASVPVPVVTGVVPPSAPSSPKSFVPTASSINHPAVVATTTTAEAYLVGPKSDLNEAIAAGIHFIESQDSRSFLLTLMPPMGDPSVTSDTEKDASFDAFVERISQDPKSAAKLDNMLQALNAIQSQNLVPAINDAGVRATYTLNPPVRDHKVLIFNKVNGFWYLDGM